MIPVEAAELIKATANAVLALYGIPEPNNKVEIMDITKALNLEANNLRNTGWRRESKDFNYWYNVR